MGAGEKAYSIKYSLYKHGNVSSIASTSVKEARCDMIAHSCKLSTGKTGRALWLTSQLA